MNRPVFASRPKMVALLLAVPVLLLAALFSNVSTASAWHADISGKADCNAVVTFTLKGWDTKSNKGSNEKIDVDYRVDGGSWTSAGTYALKLADGNVNTYSFTVPNHTKAMTVELKATTDYKWGDGSIDSNWERHSNKIQIPAPCGKPSASITEVDCFITESTITMKNEGSTAIEFTLLKDDAIAQKVTVDGKSTKAAKIKVDATTKLAVVAEGMNKVEKTVTPAKNCVAPSAAVKVVCDTKAGSGAVVTLTNKGQLSETFTVYRDGQAIGNPVVVEAGKSTNVLVPMGEDSTSTIKITSTGGVNVSETLKLDCEEPPVTTTVPPTTVVEPPVQVQGVQLAQTGVETVPMAAIAALLIAAGAGMLRSRSYFSYAGRHFS